MAHLFVKDVKPGMQINDIYMVSQPVLRNTTKGDLYIAMYLSDRTGKLNARMLKGPNPSGPIAQVHHLRRRPQTARSRIPRSGLARLTSDRNAASISVTSRVSITITLHGMPNP
jgi:hypothetical protein